MPARTTSISANCRGRERRFGGEINAEKNDQDEINHRVHDGARGDPKVGRSGGSAQPRIAIRRFTINQVGLDGLATRGLFPFWLVPQLEALVRAGMTIRF